VSIERVINVPIFAQLDQGRVSKIEHEQFPIPGIIVCIGMESQHPLGNGKGNLCNEGLDKRKKEEIQ
jgi:hypothetical protein